eukprot:c10225_g1_i2.p1 GENE.c10225_g1_i2~~c10225_g1_i2.p1  ORF type:complete len:358 (+),score=42.77 c10225_g1_i2:386-1459(+)
MLQIGPASAGPLAPLYVDGRVVVSPALAAAFEHRLTNGGSGASEVESEEGLAVDLNDPEVIAALFEHAFAEAMPELKAVIEEAPLAAAAASRTPTDYTHPAGCDDALALICATLSCLAYCPSASHMVHECPVHAAALRLVPELRIVAVHTVSEHAIRFFVAVDPALRRVFVCVRGTLPTNLANLLTDIKVAKAGWQWGGSVHVGFLEALQSTRSLLDRSIQQALAMCPSPPTVVFTGHSLGGAVATLAAMDAAASGSISAPLCYTFGCPQVGDAAFVARFNSLVPWPQSWRFVHHTDPVPKLPSSALGYSHVGSFAYISADDRIATDGDRGYLLLDGIADHSRYLVPVGTAPHSRCK